MFSQVKRFSLRPPKGQSNFFKKDFNAIIVAIKVEKQYVPQH